VPDLTFFNRPNAGSVFGTVLAVTGFSHHHPSAEDAWRRILEFFDKHLRIPA
jgi:carboxymethylenebutenolidase